MIVKFQVNSNPDNHTISDAKWREKWGGYILSRELLENIDIIYKSDNYRDDIFIDYISEDSNDIQANTCFVCIVGRNVDSHNLIHELPVEPSLIISERELDTNIPYIIVYNTKAVLSRISHNFYRKPSHSLEVIATTGTDGKTTTATIIKHLIDLYQHCAYIGTNGFHTDHYTVPTTFTTPKPIYLHKYLRRCVNDHIPFVSMEASSQGINEHRLDDVNISRAVFTNLTHEHLDYHGSLEEYFNCKLQLFKRLPETGYAIVNLDQGEYSKNILANTKVNIITYGKHPDAMFRFEEIKTSFEQTEFNLITPEKTYKHIKMNLFGDYNVYNVVAALGVIYSYGFDLDHAVAKLRHLEPIEGRMVMIDTYEGFKVIIDFAHTPNALKSLLMNIKNVNRKGRIILVFGSAGERDPSKRPLMGRIADQYCDKIFITNEDPKCEDPIDIIEHIYSGIKDPFKTEIILDRKEAIHKAIRYAEEHDIVVITGKGNENVQQFNDYKIEHNDISVSIESLSFRPRLYRFI